MDINSSHEDSHEFMKQILASNKAIECLAWLMESDSLDRTLGEDTEPEISITFVKSLYDYLKMF